MFKFLNMRTNLYLGQDYTALLFYQSDKMTENPSKQPQNDRKLLKTAQKPLKTAQNDRKLLKPAQ